MSSRISEEIDASLRAVHGDADATDAEKAEMLMEIAMGIQGKARQPSDVVAAVALYERALELCPMEHYLLHARVQARMGTALQSVPSDSIEYLERARDAYESARRVFRDHGEPEETAETEMNLGLVLQTLAGVHRAKITDAISAYQRSLRTFNKDAHPKEYAILQNNLATAFLSIPFTDHRGKMREALAVQSFEEGLKVVTLIDHPVEYAMLQNNLGNALQYSSSSHVVENNLRALEAYEEALKVRTIDASPIEYANTICNKANCLMNLPDDLQKPERGNAGRLKDAAAYYEEALGIYLANGGDEQARVVSGVLNELRSELEPAMERSN
ncbi:MAG: hypothetical protein AAGF92_15710 [Myxococcota bacterium]